LGNESVAAKNFFPDLIDVYFNQCEITGAMPDPAGLTLALGLSSKQEYEDSKKDPTIAAVLANAELRMASQWYQLLAKNKRDVNVLGVTYALRTMGYHDNFKAQGNEKSTLNLYFLEGDRRL